MGVVLPHMAVLQARRNVLTTELSGKATIIDDLARDYCTLNMAVNIGETQLLHELSASTQED